MRRPSGFAAFSVLWAGQFLSVLGTRMTNFAVSVWVWDQTGSTTQFTLTLFFAFAATVVFSPVAGAIIDRWNRRTTLMLAEIGTALATVVLLTLFLTDTATLWQLYVLNFVTGAFVAFQVPVFQATITLMMERGNYPRANAMMFAVRTTPELFAPLLAALLLATTSIELVLAVDSLSYLFAIASMLLIALPSTPPRPKDTAPSTFWQDCRLGFTYIARSRPLLNLEIFLIVINILAAVGWLLLRPMVLERTGDDADALALVLATGAIGGIGGTILVALLKTPRDKMRYVLWGTVAFSVIGRIVYGVSDVLLVLGFALIVVHMCIPVIDGYATSVWQEKVEPHLQGRVFAARQFVEELSVPIATLIAGPLLEFVIVPWMAQGQPGASLFGGLVGTGPAGGIGLVYVAIGVLGTLLAVVSFLTPSLRRIETILPDVAPEPIPDEPDPAPDIPATVGAKQPVEATVAR
ncbi:MFS transporter [Micromonospora sp. NBC_01699]|uniref:MFS transporter n=1 Tax=Micromonospora sp. NBC_01699 TaxID=2975984 RepID=UPI002E2DC154|nr:MFS transporter [Micromonospora sp. NBC_01699]